MFREFNEFISIVKVDKSPHTVRSYTSNLSIFFNEMHIDSIENMIDLTSFDIRNHMIRMKEDDKKESSINSRLRVIRLFCNWLIENNYMDNNPTNGVRNFKEPKNIPVILTKEERDSIIISCKKNIKLKFMMALLLYAGMRREEIVNIKIEDIQDGKILVHGKGRKERLLALNGYVLDLLNQYLSSRGTDFEYLFCSRKKGFGNSNGEWHKVTTETVRYNVKKAAMLAKIDDKRINDISCHTMRRTFACDLAKNGASSFQIQMALGHSNIQTTALYLRAAGADIANDAMMNQAPPDEEVRGSLRLP